MVSSYLLSYYLPVIVTNIATATDDDVITDSDVTTSLTLPQSDLIYWIFTFDLTAQQSAPIHVYVYGSNSLCTTPHVSLQVSMIHEDTSCVYHDTFEQCSFIEYNSADHSSAYCKYSCPCTPACNSLTINILPGHVVVTHVIQDVSWQPIADINYPFNV